MKKVIIALTICLMQLSLVSQTKNDQLFKSIQAGDKAKVAALLTAGCDANYFIVGDPEIKVSCLIAAVNFNTSTDIAKLLIDSKADVNWKDNLKNSAIMYAVKNNNLPMIKLLVANGAKLNEVDAQGKTLLFTANEFGYTEVVNYLEQNATK